MRTRQTHHVTARIGARYYTVRVDDVTFKFDLTTAKEVPRMGMIGQPHKTEIHWEDLPLEARPVAPPQTAEPETEAETEDAPDLPDWLNPNTTPAEEPAMVPVPLKQGDAP